MLPLSCHLTLFWRVNRFHWAATWFSFKELTAPTESPPDSLLKSQLLPQEQHGCPSWSNDWPARSAGSSVNSITSKPTYDIATWNASHSSREFCQDPSFHGADGPTWFQEEGRPECLHRMQEPSVWERWMCWCQDGDIWTFPLEVAQKGNRPGLEQFEQHAADWHVQHHTQLCPHQDWHHQSIWLYWHHWTSSTVWAFHDQCRCTTLCQLEHADDASKHLGIVHSAGPTKPHSVWIRVHFRRHILQTAPPKDHCLHGNHRLKSNHIHHMCSTEQHWCLCSWGKWYVEHITVFFVDNLDWLKA